MSEKWIGLYSITVQFVSNESFYALELEFYSLDPKSGLVPVVIIGAKWLLTYRPVRWFQMVYKKYKYMHIYLFVKYKQNIKMQ